MMFVRYQYPLANYNGKYLFTEKELVELLDKVYEKGVEDGKGVDIKTTAATNLMKMIDLENARRII